MYAVEMKVDNNKRTALQKYEMDKITAAKGKAFTVTYKNKTGCYEIGVRIFKTTKETVAWILGLKPPRSSISENVLS